MPRTEWEAARSSTPRHIDGNSSSLWRWSGAVCVAKNHVLNLLLAKETGTYRLSQNSVASRQRFCFFLLSQPAGQVFLVWMWTVLLSLWCICSIPERVHVFRPGVRGAVLSATLSYPPPPPFVFCYLACLGGRHCENQSRPGRGGPDWMFMEMTWML